VELKEACLGQRVFTPRTFDLFKDFMEEKVPQSWETKAIRTQGSGWNLKQFGEELKERAAWFGGRMADSKLANGIKIPPPLYPLRIYNHPETMVQATLLADAILNPGRVGQDMRLMLHKIPSSEHLTKAPPLQKGFYLRGLAFLGAAFDPGSAVLTHMPQNTPSPYYYKAGDVMLGPADIKDLPARGAMKKSAQHWISLRLYGRPPQSSSAPNFSQVTPICEVLVRSTFHQSEAYMNGVCAFLGDN